MKIAYNPEGGDVLQSPPSSNDIVFDVPGRALWAKGLKFEIIDDYYWANVKLSKESNTQTNPTFNSIITNTISLKTESGTLVNILANETYSKSTTLYVPSVSGQLVCHTNNTAIGSTTNPVYISESGAAVACDYSLNATINAGSSGKLAYYTGENNIKARTLTTGSSGRPIYLNAGSPTPITVSASTSNTLYLTGVTSSSIFYSGIQSASGARLVGGNSLYASGGFFEASDNKLKNFKHDINIDLEKLSQLPKKYFIWKNDNSNKLNIGTSAQELQKLYPELVSEDEEGILNVAYDKLSIIALAAIDKLYKDFNNKILILENEISNLKKTLNNLSNGDSN